MGLSNFYFFRANNIVQPALPRMPEWLAGLYPPNGHVEKDFFTETIDQLHKDLAYLVFYFQGEPFLNPDFLQMVQYASSKKFTQPLQVMPIT